MSPRSGLFHRHLILPDANLSSGRAVDTLVVAMDAKCSKKILDAVSRSKLTEDTSFTSGFLQPAGTSERESGNCMDVCMRIGFVRCPEPPLGGLFEAFQTKEGECARRAHCI